MRKNNTVAERANQRIDKSVKKSSKKVASRSGPRKIGIDVGDKTSRYCVLDGNGEVRKEGSVPASKKGMLELRGALPRCRIALEVGTHSP